MGNVTQVVGQRLQFQEQTVFIHRLLILLTAVLLIADDGLEVARREVQRVVPHSLVVLHLLVRQRLAVAMIRESFSVNQFSRYLVTLSLNDAWRQVISRPRQSRVSPVLVDSQHQSASPLTELRAWHVAVVLVLIRMCHLVAVAGIPHKPFLVARHL